MSIFEDFKATQHLEAGTEEWHDDLKRQWTRLLWGRWSGWLVKTWATAKEKIDIEEVEHDS